MLCSPIGARLSLRGAEAPEPPPPGPPQALRTGGSCGAREPAGTGRLWGGRGARAGRVACTFNRFA
eukprot:712773-Prorocentrum_minimum.AAC.1